MRGVSRNGRKKEIGKDGGGGDSVKDGGKRDGKGKEEMEVEEEGKIVEKMKEWGKRGAV